MFLPPSPHSLTEGFSKSTEDLKKIVHRTQKKYGSLISEFLWHFGIFKILTVFSGFDGF